jgi:ABC-type sugar transport system ATPase subunit
MGIRPENVSLHQYSGQSDNSISAMVNVIEPIGNRIDVYLTHATGQKFIAGIDPHTKLQANNKVKMYIDFEKIHIFEPGETGINVTLSVRPG